jgi:triosephosphate isomerase
MPRIPMIAGNWKMNKTNEEAIVLVDAMLPDLMAMGSVERVICPPFTALAVVSQRLEGSGIFVGAQNMHWEEEGAFTGEISPTMLKPFCKYVILGHSERRAYFGETDETVNKRLMAALSNDLIPILCVGETLSERDAGKTEEVVRRQVELALAGLDRGDSREIVIAYEPVWAIGTGRAATAEGASLVIGETIRGTLREILGSEFADSTRVLYGGSVKPGNALDFFQQEEIDGALVGGASLKAQDFIGIVEAALS